MPKMGEYVLKKLDTIEEKVYENSEALVRIETELGVYKRAQVRRSAWISGVMATTISALIALVLRFFKI